MKRRYGYDNQFDYHRYAIGLSSFMVPDRDHESIGDQRNCVNPLFAGALPDGSETSPDTLCNLPAGVRPTNLVFYVTMAGVPPDLVSDARGNIKLDLTNDDWTKIVGSNPDYYVFDGIDSRMVQSITPRPNLQPPPSAAYNTGTNGFREWNTTTSGAGIEYQYACTFLLPTEKDCAAAANADSCDCSGPASRPVDGTPLCDPANRALQKYGKAYPTSRYELVAKALGAQSLVGSMCPQVTTGDPTAPSYGYNPMMTALVNRVRGVMRAQ